ncbi:ATP-dependent DNA helicase DinG, partial [Bacillus sp. D-CC]
VRKLLTTLEKQVDILQSKLEWEMHVTFEIAHPHQISIPSNYDLPYGKSNGMQSNWFSRCFYQRAKNKALFADIVITNHALLFQDFSSEEPLFASCEHIIFDEAHHIEEAAR